MKRKPTVVDLFSGAGGTGLGFRQAGFKILGAVEIDPHSAKTYKENLGTKVRIGDIRNLPPEKYRHKLGLKTRDLDVLVGCPPCQGFSRMRNGDGKDDKRNDLVLRYLEFVEAFLPRFAVFENVPGLVRIEHGKRFYNRLYEGLKKLGYEQAKYEVDAVDYGVAQFRTRVIVIAGRDGEQPPSLCPTHGSESSVEVSEKKLQPWVTVEDVIKGKYPRLKAGCNGEQNGKYPNHIAPPTGEKVLNFISRVPKDGGSREQVPQKFWLDCHRTHNGHKDVYGRLSWKRPANTITAGCTNPSKGRFVHPTANRALTPREAATLQGFPDSYVFHGKFVAAQIGNAVPPPLAYVIAKKLRERIFSL